jgi:signal transduction histidine kinase
MDRERTSVLLIDDDPSDAIITMANIEQAGQDGGGTFEVEWIDSYEAGLEAALRGEHDVALVDHELHPGKGVDLIRAVVAAGCTMPMILLTGVEAREVDRMALEAGAYDFLSKGAVDAALIERSIRYSLARAATLAALAEKTEALQRSNAELEMFARAVSHDLRQPLHVIAGYTELLTMRLESCSDSGAQEMMKKILDGVERMNTMIEDLLLLARIDAQNDRARPVDCGELVSSALAEFEEVIAERGATVRVGELPSTLGRSAHLQQLFRNLLGNALKFSGDEAPIISIDCQAVGEQWHFVVRDNGIGVPEAEREEVFEPFARGAGGRKVKGTGIGLALCRKIVQQHGGRIRIEANEPRGTAVHFTLSAWTEPSPKP